MYFKVCSLCGAHLDPGELCDCRETEKEAAPRCHGNGLTQMDTSPVYQPAG